MEGECYDVCTVSGVVTGSVGRTHYKTFDGVHYSFKSSGQYYLAQTNEYNITIKHKNE